jgi:hypothetical protein
MSENVLSLYREKGYRLVNTIAFPLAAQPHPLSILYVRAEARTYPKAEDFRCRE